MNYKVTDHKDKIEEISGNATGEAQLEKSLEQIKQIWMQTDFTLLNYRDLKDKFILSSVDVIISLLEDSQVSIQTMMGSRYIVGIKQDAELWDKKLSLMSDILEEWLICQKNWM
jgi:dynein heavy chain